MFCGKRVGGYTLVELLVVIAIIGILVSLSVPAVYQVKQQMNQAQCAENLRQIAIATINYETSEGQLPGYLQKYGEFHGGVDPADPGNFGGAVPRHLKIASWPVAVLSKLDHQPLYEDPQQTAGAAAVKPLHQINGGDVYNTFANSNNYPDVARPSSLHVGGVNMAMADGSVRYISETIDHRLYQALMTPHSRASDMPSNEYIATLEL